MKLLPEKEYKEYMDRRAKAEAEGRWPDFSEMGVEEYRGGADWMDVVFVVCIVGFLILSVVWVAHQLSTIG